MVVKQVSMTVLFGEALTWYGPAFLILTFTSPMGLFTKNTSTTCRYCSGKGIGCRVWVAVGQVNMAMGTGEVGTAL